MIRLLVRQNGFCGSKTCSNVHFIRVESILSCTGLSQSFPKMTNFRLLPNVTSLQTTIHKFDENSRTFSEWVENTVGKKEKLLVTSNFSFSHSVFKRFVLQVVKPRACLGKGNRLFFHSMVHYLKIITHLFWSLDHVLGQSHSSIMIILSSCLSRSFCLSFNIIFLHFIILIALLMFI